MVECGEREGCGGHKCSWAFARTMYISITVLPRGICTFLLNPRHGLPDNRSKWNKGRADASNSLLKASERHYLSYALRLLPTTTGIMTCSMEVVLSTNCAAGLSHNLQNIKTNTMTRGMAARVCIPPVLSLDITLWECRRSQEPETNHLSGHGPSIPVASSLTVAALVSSHID